MYCLIYEQVTECGHVFHEECIISWMMISSSCPVCKQDDVEYTKLFLDLSDRRNELRKEIVSLKSKLTKYKQLAVAQSKSIAARYYEISQSELKIKQITAKNRRLQRMLAISNASISLDVCTKCGDVNAVNIYHGENLHCFECWQKMEDLDDTSTSHFFDRLYERGITLTAECQELQMADIFNIVKDYNLQNRVKSPALKRRKLKSNNVMLTKQMMEMRFME